MIWVGIFISDEGVGKGNVMSNQDASLGWLRSFSNSLKFSVFYNENSYFHALGLGQARLDARFMITFRITPHLQPQTKPAEATATRNMLITWHISEPKEKRTSKSSKQIKSLFLFMSLAQQLIRPSLSLMRSENIIQIL